MKRERRIKASLFSVSQSEGAQRPSVAQLQGGLLFKAAAVGGIIIHSRSYPWFDWFTVHTILGIIKFNKLLFFSVTHLEHSSLVVGVCKA